MIEGDELYTRVHKNMAPEESQGWTIVLMDRATRFLWDLHCGRKERKMFKKAMGLLCEVIQQTGDLTLLTDGEKRYGSLLFELWSQALRNGRRCFRAVDLLPSRSQGEPSTRVREAMIIQVLHCPYCQGSDIVKHGMSPEGKQRYRCRACLEGRGRTFLLEYSYAGQSPEVKQQIVDMAMNARGIRETARVLHVSPTTVIKELKKKNLTSNR